MRFTDFHGGHVLDDRWFHVAFSSDPSHIRCHIGAYFRFGWDIRIFTEVTCSTIDDFMSLFFWPVPHSMPYWGHISVSIEIYGSSWSCMLIPTYEIHTDMIVSSVEPLRSYPVRPTLRDASMSSCFPSGRRPFWSMGLIQLYTWMIWIAHSMTGDLSSSGSSDLSHIRCHTGAYPHPWVHQIFCVFFLITWSTSGSLRDVMLGHPPLSFTFGASPHCNLRSRHPPTVIYVWGIPPLSFTFGASPHCHLCLRHPPSVIYVRGIPPLSFMFGASPHCHFV